MTNKKMRRSENPELDVISLFCGCGGFDLGFEGEFEFLNHFYPSLPYNVVYATDINERACMTYRNNFEGAEVVCEDFTERLDKLDQLPEADIILGGFPCKDFSVSGKRQGLKTKRGNLYLSMVEAVNEKKPIAFIAENVKGLLNIEKGEVIEKIENDFVGVGYNVNIKLYNTADYGVPQTRERIIICGIREDIDVEFQPPSPTHGDTNKMKLNFYDELQPWVGAREALQDLEKVKEGDFPNHFWSKAKLNPGTQGNKKIKADEPSTTIRSEHHGNIEFHYSEPRRLSAREAARLQSFPDDFIFYKSTTNAYKQVGNAVPPVFAWHIAKALLNTLTAAKEVEEVPSFQDPLSIGIAALEKTSSGVLVDDG